MVRRQSKTQTVVSSTPATSRRLRANPKAEPIAIQDFRTQIRNELKTAYDEQRRIKRFNPKAILLDWFLFEVREMRHILPQLKPKTINQKQRRLKQIQHYIPLICECNDVSGLKGRLKKSDGKNLSFDSSGRETSRFVPSPPNLVPYQSHQSDEE